MTKPWEGPDGCALAFAVKLDDYKAVELWAESKFRNRLLWNLSKHVLAYEKEGVVSVTRYNNGEWEPCDDWRKLSN